MASNPERLLFQLDLARRLIVLLEAGDEDESIVLIRQLRAPYEKELFEELGKLTRDLHESLKIFHGDSRLVEISRDEIPDAKERLNYVVSMTERATHRTLNAVDEALPIAESLQARLIELASGWNRFRNRDLSLQEFREFARELDAFFASSLDEMNHLRSLLSEVIMAQDFQDLTGQIIRRVIKLVQDLEDNLVGIIRLSSIGLETTKIAQQASINLVNSTHPGGPIVPHTKDEKANVVSGQDDVDALLSSLGF